MSSGVTVSLLGLVEVRRALAVAPIPGRKVQALVALLALSASRPVSDDRLIDEVWNDDRLANRMNSLQAQVSNLRRVLGREAVVRQGAGYMLTVEPEDVDALRFELLVDRSRRLLADGDRRTAAQGFRTALSLIRGPPLGELLDFGFVQEVLPRIEEARLAAHEGLADAELAAGRHAELVGPLAELVAHHPLRERFHAQLMTALYRSGRQSDALRAFADARRVLIDELGLEPGPELRDLRQAMLNQDPGLEAPSPEPRPDARADGRTSSSEPTHVGATLIGRDREIAQLLDDLDEAVGGHGRIALLGGEPGAGKSRLADEVAMAAAERGTFVVRAACRSGRGVPAFWPWIQVVRASVMDADPELVLAALGHGAGDIARLVPEVGDLLGITRPQVQPADVESERFRLCDHLSSYLRRASARRPIVVVVEDLQWADPASLDVLAMLAGVVLESPILLLATYRNVGVAADGPLAATLADLARQPIVRHVELDGLDRASVAVLLGAAGQVATDAVVDALHRRTQGNPFFLVETLRLEAGRDHLLDPARVPTGVRDVVRQRVGALPAATVDVMNAAAVLGPEFDLAPLAAMLDQDAPTTFRTLEPAFSARLMTTEGPAHVRCRFAHGLVRDTMYDALGVVERASLHRQAGLVLERGEAAARGPQVMALAEHWFHAVPVASPERGIGYAVTAARWARRHASHERAEEHLLAALVLVDTLAADAPRRSELEMAVQDELSVLLISTSGYAHPGVARACARMRELDVDDPARSIPALWRLAMLNLLGNELDAAVALAQELLLPPGNGVDDGRALAGHMILGPIHINRGDLAQARRHLDRAAELQVTDAVRHVEAFMAETPGVWIASMSAWCAVLAGDDDRADDDLRHAQAGAADSAGQGNGYPSAYASWAASLVAIVGRDVDTARRRCEDGIANAMATGNGTMFVPFLSAQLGWAEAMAGDLESGVAQLQGGMGAIQAAEADAWQHVFQALLADAHLGNGQVVEALAHADEGLGHVGGGGSCWFAAELHRLRGEALLASGRLGAATTALRRAVDVARDQGATALERRAAASLTRCSTVATTSEGR